MFNDGTLALDQTRIISNAATGNAGGGIRNLGSLTLDRVDVAQNLAANGAGIYNDGMLAIHGSSIFDKQAANNGGGIFNAGQAQIINSAVSINHAPGFGGGIETYGTTAFTSSTVSFNQAGIGAGIHSRGDLAIVDSTVAINHARLKGGGVTAYPDARKSVKILNSTIAFNGAYSNGGDDGDGGGIYVDNGLVDMRNSLLVGNYYNGAQRSFEDCYTASAGVLRTFGVNLSTTPTAFCNIRGSLSTLNSLDFLGPLKSNGGPTQTIALLHGSNATNAGINCTGPDSNPLLTDQRGFARVVGGPCDVGAYESDPDRIFTNGFE